MATARKLPSGSYRVRKYDYTDENGKKHYKSFTASNKAEAEQLARDYSSGSAPHKTMTLNEAMTEYIDNRTSTFSPRTVSSYKSIRDNYLKCLSGKKLNRITQADIQRAINIEAAHLSAKTVHNIHGFLTAVMYTYRPDFQIRTALPKKVRSQINVPSESSINRLMEAIKDTDMELPVLLAAFGPMRRGEICALRAEDISGNVVHVCRNIVKSADADVWREKAPKSFAGDRYIEFPDFVRKKWESTGITSGRFVTICPDTITKKFPLILQENGIPHFRFHDLRHYSASIQHALGVPDVYIMQRGGWGNDSALKQVYRHAMESQEREQNQRINDYFSEKYDTKYDTKKKRPRK